ncbi:hypothetical protein EX30DRAFT_334934 [Ascodesmis nigricans]|uniref:WAC domain-containing protein n=1 Tax=Ascodesmis nigricans TaxID=341454 RepID=A0A4S2MLJ7_9PEZI|nr:hypothetical protein EX30DRAFT_334934 [Ascodesmis nigricans]
MVLYKRKPVQIIPPKDIPDDRDKVAWQIPETGELFTDRQAYDERMSFYTGKVFSCEITGHMNLTFFEALQSEVREGEEILKAFPEPLKEPVLRKIQFSTISRIDALVDSLHEHFKTDFYPGETVTAFLDGGERAEALIREKTMFPELRLPNGEIQRKGFSRYIVKLINKADEEAQVDNEHINRDKKTFTKAMLRAFIKNTVSREPWNGAPWLVKDEFARKYKIGQDVPSHLQRPSTAADRKAAQARRKQGSGIGAILTNGTASPAAGPSPPVEIRPAPKSHKSKNQQAMRMARMLAPMDQETDGNSASGTPFGDSPTPDASGKGVFKVTPITAPAPKPIKYPIEDLALPPSAEGRRRPKLHRLSEMVVVQNGNGSNQGFNGIDENLTAFYLSTWVFLNIYCEPLVLDSFTFDDYVQAMFFKSDEIDCDMLNEIHCSLLKAIVNEQGNLQCQLPEMEYEDEEDEEEDDQDGENSSPNGEVSIKEGHRHANGNDTSNGKSAPREKKHRAGDLFDGDDTWIKQLKIRNFRNGGWQVIMCGLLHQLSMDTRFAPDIEPILAFLAPPDETPSQESVRTRYGFMDPNLRIMATHMLAQLTHQTRTVRDYMEECSEEMTKHRKEKIEHQRSRKQLLEELKSLEDDKKILLPENTPKSPTPELESESRRSSIDGSQDIQMNGVDSEDEAEPNRAGLRRGNDRKRKRGEEEKLKSEPVSKLPKTSKQFQKVLRSIDTVKSKIKKEEADIQSLDEDLRQADCSRFKCLGKDRYWNTYYWFERNGMPYGGLPSSSTAHAKYANAMIWIQGPGPSERQGFLVEECALPPPTDVDGDITMNGATPPRIPVLERQEIEESGTTLDSPIQYGYISTPTELAALLSWLDPKGIRERKLIQALENYKKHILLGMENRARYLAGDPDFAPPQQDRDMGGSGGGGTGSGRQTRAKAAVDLRVWRCLTWRNDSMVEEKGHSHYEHPLPKGKKKAAQMKNVPLNRNGKPVSRQGERYNF